ncbi:MAG: trehalose-phosphatase [Pseudomonadota bacterium]
MKTTHDTLPMLSREHALFLDFDGTLAPIQDDPETVALPRGGDDLLLRLAEWLDGALTVISGRDVRDLSARVPLGLLRAGGHGLEICAPGEAPAPAPPPAPEGLADELAKAVGAHPGARLEDKGSVFAVHYRAAPHHGPSLHGALAEVAQTIPDYSLQSGKMVFELKPSGANKGKALERIMGLDPFAGRVPVMVGDDTTDEDAMGVAMTLGGFAIKVGAGESLARHRLAEPSAVFAWLEECLR